VATAFLMPMSIAVGLWHGRAQITRFGAASGPISTTKLLEQIGGSARGYPASSVPLATRLWSSAIRLT
jgi:hypothetical protein